MAGNRVVEVEEQDLGGIKVQHIIPNGNVEAGDEWGLFRLTDDGKKVYYEIGCELAAGILGLEISGKSAVEEVSRHASEVEAQRAWEKLAPEEKERTLIRSVRPKSEKTWLEIANRRSLIGNQVVLDNRVGGSEEKGRIKAIVVKNGFVTIEAAGLSRNIWFKIIDRPEREPHVVGGTIFCDLDEYRQIRISL